MKRLSDCLLLFVSFPVPDPLLSGPDLGRHRLPGNLICLSAVLLFPRKSVYIPAFLCWTISALLTPWQPYLPAPCCCTPSATCQKPPSLCPVPPARSLPRPRCQPQARRFSFVLLPGRPAPCQADAGGAAPGKRGPCGQRHRHGEKSSPGRKKQSPAGKPGLPDVHRDTERAEPDLQGNPRQCGTYALPLHPHDRGHPHGKPGQGSGQTAGGAGGHPPHRHDKHSGAASTTCGMTLSA